MVWVGLVILGIATLALRVGGSPVGPVLVLAAWAIWAVLVVSS